jgi:hypothetical protein
MEVQKKILPQFPLIVNFILEFYFNLIMTLFPLLIRIMFTFPIRIMFIFSIRIRFKRIVWSFIFTKLDLSAGYHQIRLHPEDTYKMVFRTYNSHYEYLVMPSELCNTLYTF